MTGREIAVLAGILLVCMPVLAAYLRHRSGTIWVATSAAAIAAAGFLALLGYLLHRGPDYGLRPWVFGLVASAMPFLLAAYAFSAVLGRDNPRAALQRQKRTWIGLLSVSAVVLLFLRDASFITGYRWSGDTGTILFGAMGKAYLSFLLVGMVFIGYNLENTYRMASGATRERLRPVIVGMFGVLGFFTYVLTTGLLYSGVKLDNLVASVAPLGIAAVLTSYGFLRGTLSDASVPVSRSVVYSSFTAFVAALYVLAVGVAAQLASFTRWTPGQVVTVSFIFLVVLGGITFGFSNRLQRSVRRFIDRNFYVNRYDYRTQWFRVTRSLDPSQGTDGVLRAAAALFEDVFHADAVTFALSDRATGTLRPRLGKGTGEATAVLAPNSPLGRKFKQDRRSLLLERQADDFEYIPIYVENREWLDLTASQVVAPMLAGPELLGCIGLERKHPDDHFTFEDLALLDSMSAQVAAVLRSVSLAQELADSREMELLSQWSSMILHDFKNYLGPLRLIVQNMRIHRDNPDFQRAAMEDLIRVADRMERLMRRLSELREGPRAGGELIDVSDLVEQVLDDLETDRRPGLEVVTHLKARGLVSGDADLLRRVLENLVVNAVEAMEGEGRIAVRTETPSGAQEGGELLITVSDTGPGMDEAFLRDGLFRPFTSTKHNGLGLGLVQCRAIVEAHGGELHVESRPGHGCTMQVVLRVAKAIPTELRMGTGGKGRQG